MGIKVHEDGFKEPIISHKSVSESYVKVYEDAVSVLHDVHGCPRILIDYFSIIMDKNNMITVSVLVKQQFLEDLLEKTNGKVSYSFHMIEKAMKKLKENNLLIPHSRGIYQVNPEYFYKGKSESFRIELIKKNLERKLK